MSPIVPDFVQSEFQGRKDRQGRKDEDRNKDVLYHRMTDGITGNSMSDILLCQMVGARNPMFGISNGPRIIKNAHQFLAEDFVEQALELFKIESDLISSAEAVYEIKYFFKYFFTKN